MAGDPFEKCRKVQTLRFLALALALAASWVFLAAPPVQGQDAMRPAAIVNDEVISVLDLAQRLRIAIVSSGLEDTQETRNRLTRPVLRQLIDEKLQLQEAARLDISVEPEQLEAAIAEIASRNNMNVDQFTALLQRSGILRDYFENQIRAQISWSQVISRRLLPTIQISDEEVDAVIDRQAELDGQTQSRVKEIFLDFDSPEEESQVRATAERLVEQLRGGADFAAVARQFSQSATASLGGDLGWILEGELPDEVDAQVKQLSTGRLAGPIRSTGGYYIIAVIDRRQVQAGGETRLRLMQLQFPAPPGQESVMAAEAARASAEIVSCAQAETLPDRVAFPVSVAADDVALSQLPEGIRTVVADLPVGKPSEPIVGQGGVIVLLVCLRETDEVSREEIERTLERERMDLLARRYLRDLRRDANIEIRI